MILNIVGYRFSEIKRFDIVVVDREKEYIIKRVIGLPGETIEYKDNELYVNGNKVVEKYDREQTEDFTVKVPEGSYFVLGDNRINSLDSRYFGPFKRNKILGKTSLTLYPFDRIGTKK
jgi:signal peptidase I